MALEVDRIQAVLSAYADLSGFEVFERRANQSVAYLQAQARQINSIMASAGAGGFGQLGQATRDVEAISAAMERLQARQRVLSGARGNYTFTDDLKRQLSYYREIDIVTKSIARTEGSRRGTDYSYQVLEAGRTQPVAQGTAPTRAAMEADVRTQLARVMMPALLGSLETMRRETARFQRERALPAAPNPVINYSDTTAQRFEARLESVLDRMIRRGTEPVAQFDSTGRISGVGTYVPTQTVPLQDRSAYLASLQKEVELTERLRNARGFSAVEMRAETNRVQSGQLTAMIAAMEANAPTKGTPGADFLRQFVGSYGIADRTLRTQARIGPSLLRGMSQDALNDLFGRAMEPPGYYINQGRWKQHLRLPGLTPSGVLDQQYEDYWRGSFDSGFQSRAIPIGPPRSPSFYGGAPALPSQPSVSRPIALRDFFVGGSTIFDQLPRVFRARRSAPRSEAPSVDELISLLSKPTYAPPPLPPTWAEQRRAAASLAGTYFHGSNVPGLTRIEPGLVGSSRHTSTQAYVTADPLEAWRYAQLRREQMGGLGVPTVYQVAPSPDMRRHTDPGYVASNQDYFASPTGFNVVRAITSLGALQELLDQISLARMQGALAGTQTPQFTYGTSAFAMGGPSASYRAITSGAVERLAITQGPLIARLGDDFVRAVTRSLGAGVVRQALEGGAARLAIGQRNWTPPPASVPIPMPSRFPWMDAIGPGPTRSTTWGPQSWRTPYTSSAPYGPFLPNSIPMGATLSRLALPAQSSNPIWDALFGNDPMWRMGPYGGSPLTLGGTRNPLGYGPTLNQRAGGVGTLFGQWGAAQPTGPVPFAPALGLGLFDSRTASQRSADRIAALTEEVSRAQADVAKWRAAIAASTPAASASLTPSQALAAGLMRSGDASQIRHTLLGQVSSRTGVADVGGLAVSRADIETAYASVTGTLTAQAATGVGVVAAQQQLAAAQARLAAAVTALTASTTAAASAGSRGPALLGGIPAMLGGRLGSAPGYAHIPVGAGTTPAVAPLSAGGYVITSAGGGVVLGGAGSGGGGPTGPYRSIFGTPMGPGGGGPYGPGPIGTGGGPGWWSSRRDEFATGFRGRGDRPYMEQFGQAAKFSLMYGVAYNALFQIGQIFQQSLQQAMEFESALVNLNIVTGRASDANMELANNLGDIAAASGFAPSEGVNAGARAIGIFGLTEASQAEQEAAALRNATVVTQTAFASGRPFENIQKDIGAIVQAFKLGPEMQTAIQDYDAVLSKKFGITTGSTFETVAQVGTLGAEAGMSMEEVFAAAAKVQSRTGQTPAATAGMLSQIFGRAGDAGVRSKFAELGVDTSRSFRDQLAQMSEIFPTLGAQEQAQVFDVFGKGRGKGAATIVVQDWAQIQEAAGAAKEDVGAGQAQWNERMATVTGALATLSGEFMNLAKNIGESGLLDVFGVAVTVLTTFVGAINSVVEAFNLIPRWARDAAIAVGLFTAALYAGNKFGASRMGGMASPWSPGAGPTTAGYVPRGAGGPTVFPGQPGYRTAGLRDWWANRAWQPAWLQPGYQLRMPQMPTGQGFGGVMRGVAGGIGAGVRGAGAVLGSEMGVLGTAMIGVGLIQSALSTTNANLAAMEAFKNAATADFGTSAEDLDAAARALSEASNKLEEQANGPSQIWNWLGQLLGGPDVAAEAQRADQLASVYEDAANKQRDAQEAAGRALDPAGVAASIDLSSADALKSSLDLLDSQGRSATTQFFALADALKAAGDATNETASALLSRMGPTVGARVQAGIGQRFTTLTDIFDNSQGTFIDEALRRSGIRWMSTAPTGTKVTGTNGNTIDISPEQAQSIANSMRDTDITALSAGVGGAVGNWISQGGNPLDPAQRAELASVVEAQYALYVKDWTTLPLEVQQSIVAEGVNAAISEAQGVSKSLDRGASLDAVLKFGPKLAELRSKEAALTGSGPQALTQAQTYLSGLQLVRQRAVEASAGPDQLEQIDVAILEAEQSVAQAQLAHIQAILDYQTSKTASTDVVGQLTLKMKSLIEQINLTDDPDAQSKLWAEYYRTQNQRRTARVERRSAQRSAGVSPYDTVGAATAERDNAQDAFDLIAEDEKDLEKKSAAYWQAYQRLQQSKVSLAEAEAENALQVKLATIDPRDKLGQAQARIDSLQARLNVPEGSPGYLPIGSTERATVEQEIAQARDQQNRDIAAQNAAVRRAGIDPRNDVGLALDAIQAATEAVNLEIPGTEAWARAQAELAQARQDYADVLSRVSAAARRAAINPRDTTALALDAVKAAKDALAQELRGTEAWYQAKTALNDARMAYQDTLRQVAASRAQARAIRAGGQIASATADLAAAEAELKAQVKGTKEYWDAMGRVYAARDALAQAQQADALNQALLGIDITDPVAEANARLDAARRKLERDRRKNKSPEVLRQDELDVRQAEMQAESARFSQWLSDLQTNEQLKRITHGEYMRTLEAERDRLLAVADRTRQQQDELNQIEQAIQSAKMEMDAQWNIGDIRIPTPYEMRSWLARQAGGYYAAPTTAAGTSAAPVSYSPPTSRSYSASSSTQIYINGADTGMVQREIHRALGRTVQSSVGVRPRKG